MPRISITGKKKPALADSPRFMHNLPSVHPSKMIYILKSGRLLWKFPSRFFSFLPLWWTKGCFNCSLADLGTKPRQNLGRLEKMLEPFLFLRNIGFYVGFALLVLWHDVPMWSGCLLVVEILLHCDTCWEIFLNKFTPIFRYPKTNMESNKKCLLEKGKKHLQTVTTSFGVSRSTFSGGCNLLLACSPAARGFLSWGRVAGFIDSDGVAGVFWMGVVGEDDVYVHYIQIETN